MIKYVELTAPESSEFRQAKILSVEISVGDRVSVGDTLFRVRSGSNEIDLPSTKDGRITEVIALADENISVMTPLILLETEVASSTATPPIVEAEDHGVDKKDHVENQQPQQNTATKSGDDAQESITDSKAKHKKTSKQKQASKAKSKQVGEVSPKDPKSKSKQGLNVKQQSLDLDDEVHAQGDASESDDIEELVLVNKVDMSTEQTSEIEQTSRRVHTPTEAPATQTDSAQISANIKTSSNSMNKLSVVVPDIGTDNAKVIEVFVKVGDQVNVEDPLIALESDKASMDVPSPYAGVVESIAVAIDQDVAEGTEILIVTEAAGQDAATDSTVAITETADQDNAAADSSDSDDSSADDSSADDSSADDSGTDDNSAAQLIEIAVPDIGGDSAKVIEILVEVGQTVAKEDSLITLESDKASMEVPSSHAGEISSIEVQLDQELSEGSIIVTVKTSAGASDSDSKNNSTASVSAAASTSPTTTSATQASSPPTTSQESTAAAAPAPVTAAAGKAHASPSIRRFARELGVDLSRIAGTGRKGRIAKSDISGFVKGIMTGSSSNQAAAQGGSGIPLVPAVDFTKFGEIDVQPLNKIKRLTASTLHRSWLNVPHVTHDDESNISDLEAFRKQINGEYKQQNKAIKLSPLAFIVKAVVNGLQTYPQFNSSLEPGGENLIYKKYINIGIAVETPNGLVVPVIRDADKKSVADIAVEMGELAKKARDKKLTPADMSGACFTISSLGGIGGTHFTPIVNAPEVAILGVSRSKIQPVWNGEEFEPAMMLPLSLSYDHRVIDGAEAARFTRHLAAILEDVRRLTV